MPSRSFSSPNVCLSLVLKLNLLNYTFLFHDFPLLFLTFYSILNCRKDGPSIPIKIQIWAAHKNLRSACFFTFWMNENPEIRKQVGN